MSRKLLTENRTEHTYALRRGRTVKVRMPDELIESLQYCSRAHGVSQAQIIRLVLQHTLPIHEGSITYTTVDLSAEINRDPSRTFSTEGM